MIATVIALIVGIIIGAFIGVALIAVCCISKNGRDFLDDDDWHERD